MMMVWIGVLLVVVIGCGALLINMTLVAINAAVVDARDVIADASQHLSDINETLEALTSALLQGEPPAEEKPVTKGQVTFLPDEPDEPESFVKITPEPPTPTEDEAKPDEPPTDTKIVMPQIGATSVSWPESVVIAEQEEPPPPKPELPRSIITIIKETFTSTIPIPRATHVREAKPVEQIDDITRILS